MNKCIELYGQHFGCLTVIKRSETNANNRKAQWICECGCGRQVIVRSDNLRDGRTTKCSLCRNKAGRPSVFYFGGGEDE